MKKETISFEQFTDPSFRREQQMKIKSEAVWVSFKELGGLINISRLAEEYFHKSQSWFSQKLNGINVCGKERSFTPEEYAEIAKAFRDIATRLQEYADAIDNAE